MIWQIIMKKVISFFCEVFQNSRLDVLLTFYHRNYLLGSCDFILVMDIKVQKTHGVGCPNQNFDWQRTLCQDIDIESCVQMYLISLTVCTAYNFQKLTYWSDSKFKSVLYPSIQVRMSPKEIIFPPNLQ